MTYWRTRMTARELGLDDDTDWRELGNCVQEGVDPEVMQPELATLEQVGLAKRICRGCPVWDQCNGLALSQRDPITGELTAYGVHAGRWFGEPPGDPEVYLCEWCQDPLEVRYATFCINKATCSSRLERLRASGAEPADPEPGICPGCGDRTEVKAPKFCGVRCRVAAKRARDRMSA